MKKYKIIFIPGDNIELKISRCYLIAENLSKFCEIYWLHWYDTRNKYWKGEKNTVWNSISCMLKSLFRKRSVIKSEIQNFYYIRQPFLNQYVIRYIIGEKLSRILMREVNRFFIEGLIKRIKPDFIFYSDGFYYTNLNKSGVQYFTDIQDDFDDEENSIDLLNYEIKRGKKYFKHSLKNYVITKKVKEHFSNLFFAEFEILENGADFGRIRNIKKEEIAIIKSKYGLSEDTIILSYIGGLVWFDFNFVEKLITRLNKSNIEFRLFLIGNLPKVDDKNVINLGILKPNETYKYYLLTDVGLLLKNSLGSDFLYNSLPLKIVQYSAARKPVISFPIKWVEEENFQNVFILNDNIEDWVNMIISLKDFTWNDSIEKQWAKYDWNNIVSRIVRDLDHHK